MSNKNSNETFYIPTEDDLDEFEYAEYQKWKDLENLKPQQRQNRLTSNEKYQELTRGKDLTEEQKKEIRRKLQHNYVDLSNPYRKDSSLDLYDTMQEYRWIETGLLLKLIKIDLSSSDLRVFFYILNRTRGYCNKNKFYKHMESITNKDIQEYTNLTRSTVFRSLKNLKMKHIVYESLKEGKTLIGINYRWDTWIN